MIYSKVKAGFAGGAGATVLISVAKYLGYEMPVELAGAIITLVGFVAGYLKPEKAGQDPDI